MKIQHTNIVQHGKNSFTVNMLVSNFSDPDKSQEMVWLVSHVEMRGESRGSSPALADLQLAAINDAMEELELKKREIETAIGT